MRENLTTELPRRRTPLISGAENKVEELLWSELYVYVDELV